MIRHIFTALAIVSSPFIANAGFEVNHKDHVSSHGDRHCRDQPVAANYYTHLVTYVSEGSAIPFDQVQYQKGFKLKDDGRIVLEEKSKKRLYSIEFHVETAPNSTSSTIVLEVNGKPIPASRHTEYPGAENNAQALVYLKKGDVIRVVNGGSGVLITENVNDPLNTTATITIVPV